MLKKRQTLLYVTPELQINSVYKRKFDILKSEMNTYVYFFSNTKYKFEVISLNLYTYVYV